MADLELPTRSCTNTFPHFQHIPILPIHAGSVGVCCCPVESSLILQQPTLLIEQNKVSYDEMLKKILHNLSTNGSKYSADEASFRRCMKNLFSVSERTVYL